MKKANNNNNTVKNQNVKIVPMGKKLTEADIAALEARLAAAEKALEEERAAKAELEAKVKTSKNRAVKSPDSYDVFQPIGVAIRGSINQGIVENDTLIKIWNDTLKTLSITITPLLAAKFIDKTIAHNSISNMAKAKDYNSAIGRYHAFCEMYNQARVLLPIIPVLEDSPIPAAIIAAAKKIGFDIEKEVTKPAK